MSVRAQFSSKTKVKALPHESHDVHDCFKKRNLLVPKWHFLLFSTFYFHFRYKSTTKASNFTRKIKFGNLFIFNLFDTFLISEYINGVNFLKEEVLLLNLGNFTYSIGMTHELFIYFGYIFGKFQF